MTTFQITPLHPSLGAEIAGVDLSQPVDEPTRQALSHALADHLAHGDYDRSQSRVLWRIIVEGDRPRLV